MLKDRTAGDHVNALADGISFLIVLMIVQPINLKKETTSDSKTMKSSTEQWTCVTLMYNL